VVGLLNNPFNLTLLSSKAEEIEDTSITLCSNSTENWQHLVKRTLDVSLSLVATVVFAPLFVVTAILVKLTSPGPIFFMQERVGLNKRRFRMCKFRTMVQDAEQRMAEIEHLNEVSGPVFKIKKDPRITPIGRILRAASIDELPQLFNVLKSDMSLVGPRPLPVRDYEGFDQDWKRRRFSVRPGITCLWQINGRSTTPFEEWMKLDMQYIDQWSLWLDLKILAMTVPAVLKGAGAS
jgi:exopolysaccharide biosynthesis polyprenyl glycosylphosphotransferase